jgi:hypothetical protein
VKRVPMRNVKSSTIDELVVCILCYEFTALLGDFPFSICILHLYIACQIISHMLRSY